MKRFLTVFTLLIAMALVAVAAVDYEAVKRSDSHKKVRQKINRNFAKTDAFLEDTVVTNQGLFSTLSTSDDAMGLDIVNLGTLYVDSIVSTGETVQVGDTVISNGTFTALFDDTAASNGQEAVYISDGGDTFAAGLFGDDESGLGMILGLQDAGGTNDTFLHLRDDDILILNKMTYVNGNLIPNLPNAYDLGTAGNPWQDLHLDGVEVGSDGTNMLVNSSAIPTVSGTNEWLGLNTFEKLVYITQIQAKKTTTNGVTGTNIPTLIRGRDSLFGGSYNHFSGGVQIYGGDSSVSLMEPGSVEIIAGHEPTRRLHGYVRLMGGDLRLETEVGDTESGNGDITMHIHTNTTGNIRGILELLIGTNTQFYVTNGTFVSSVDIVPSESNVYSLGSASFPWDEIYVSTGSLQFVGGVALSSTADELLVDGNALLTTGGGELTGPLTNDWGFYANWGVNSSGGGPGIPGAGSNITFTAGQGGLDGVPGGTGGAGGDITFTAGDGGQNFDAAGGAGGDIVLTPGTGGLGGGGGADGTIQLEGDVVAQSNVTAIVFTYESGSQLLDDGTNLFYVNSTNGTTQITSN